MKFDELNQLEDFFSKMNIKNKKERVSLAMKLDEALLYIFLLIDAETKLKREKREEDYYESLMLRFADIFDEDDLSYEDEYLHDVAMDIIDTTFDHIDDPFFVSRERALLIAENETNTIYNHKEYVDAIQDGMEYKTWCAEMDERTRFEHMKVDSMRIPINEMFPVGNDLMRYPRDYINGSPENTANCRCVCIYS